MNVRDVMTADPACCTPETGLQEVARMMEENDCGCVPLVKDENSKELAGVVTDRDIVMRAGEVVREVSRPTGRASQAGS